MYDVEDGVADGQTDGPVTVLAFAGDRYYPAGGAHDLVGMFGSEADALAALVADGPCDWAHLLVIEPDGSRRMVLIR